MQKTKRGKSRLVWKTAGQVRPRKGPNRHEGLVLDDFLATLDATRKAYKLPEPTFGLEQIERQPGARLAVETIITRSLALHAPNIYAKPHPLLNKIYDIRHGKRIKMKQLFSGWQIQPTHASQVLRALLEWGLQTITQLPKKDPSLNDGTRELELLASHCDKLAQEIQDTALRKEIRKRALLYFGRTKESGLDQFSLLAEELRKKAKTVRAILANTRLAKQKYDSPNPQIRVALYVVGWLEASSGKKQYAPFGTLLNAAYTANNIDTPAWVNRLAIEMTRRRDRRKAWAKSITV